MKRRIRLTESDLHRIIDRSVKRVLKEDENNSFYNSDYKFEDYDEDRDGVEFDHYGTDSEELAVYAEEIREKLDNGELDNDELRRFLDVVEDFCSCLGDEE